jgi:mycothiol system anti-sigma-R factor
VANCSETIAELTAYLDGELGEERLEVIKGHLEHCLSCDDRACFEEKLKELIRSRCQESMPPDLLAKIRARIATVEV